MKAEVKSSDLKADSAAVKPIKQKVRPNLSALGSKSNQADVGTNTQRSAAGKPTYPSILLQSYKHT